jgi:uncharacterized protein (DUF302 family)
MSYYFHKKIRGNFEDVLQQTTTALAIEGFGVLTEIDVQATLKKKLNVDFRPYRILGACHPQSAYQALQLEDKIGLLLPCNLIVQEVEKNLIEVAILDPFQTMQVVNQPALIPLAKEITEKLHRVLEKI